MTPSRSWAGRNIRSPNLQQPLAGACNSFLMERARELANDLPTVIWDSGSNSNPTGSCAGPAVDQEFPRLERLSGIGASRHAPSSHTLERRPANALLAGARSPRYGLRHAGSKAKHKGAP